MSTPDDLKIAAKLRGIQKSFGDGESRIQVLKGIDLDVRSGDITMLVGPSGCGKTTLISIIASPRMRGNSRSSDKTCAASAQREPHGFAPKTSVSSFKPFT